MADYKKLIPFIKTWEAGFANDPSDLGGATMSGITLNTFRFYYGKSKTVNDLKHMTEAQWEHIFKEGFWDKWKGDEIKSDKVAFILIDWLWASGSYAIKRPQRMLGLVDDGIVGEKTISAINSRNSTELFNDIYNLRVKFIDEISKKRPANKKFKKGWLRRISSLKTTYQ